MRASFNRRIVAAVACVLAAGGLIAGQSPPPQEPPAATFRSSVEAVQLTAIVKDASGMPVSGLAAADFEIVENGRPQPITTFAAIDIPLDSTDRSAGRSDVIGNDRPPGRTFVIALDDMVETNALRARVFLRRFLEKYFGPNDTGAVVLTTRGPRDSGQEFTSDVQLLLNAVDRFGGGRIEGMTGARGNIVRVRNALGDLRELTESLAKLPGRKALIFVSESLPEYPDDGCGCDPFDVIDYRPGPLGGVFSKLDPDFHRAISAATRGNVAIYPIHPSGLTTDLAAPGSFDTSHLERRMGLQGLAAVTGGFALTNSNGYDAAFERLVREHSTYYLLGFNSAETNRDGRYVRVEVRVKRPGLQVQSLAGYLAPRGRQERNRTPGAVLAAVWDSVTSPMTTSGLPMRLFAAPFKGDGRNAAVALSLELDAARLNLVERDGAFRGELEIIIAVTDAQKRRWPMMRHRATLALKPATFERVRRSGLRVVSQLALPKGRYQIRVSAGGAVTAGSVVYDLAVPDFSDDFTLGGVVLTSSHVGDALTVVPDRRLTLPIPAVPSTAREFAADDVLLLYSEAYENRRQPHTADLSIEIRDQAGRPMANRVLDSKAGDKPAGATVHRFTQSIALDELPPGAYSLRLQARSSLDGRPQPAREIPFTVR